MSGTPRPTITAGQPSPGDVPAAAVAQARESFLYSDPGWVTATDHALPGTTPFHTVARRRPDEYALLPAYLVTEPPFADLDPLTYLQAGGSSCCGTPAEATTPQTGDLLPAVVLGSPLAFHSEPFFTFWNERLLPDMVTATLEAARAAGARSVVAPWITQRLTGMDLAGELRNSGAAGAFWGADEYIELTADSLETHLAGVDRKRRFRMRADSRHAERIADLQTLSGSDLDAHLEAMAALVSRSYQRHGTSISAGTLRSAFGNLQDKKALQAVCAFDTADSRLIAVHLLIHRGQRLYGKWFGQEEEVSRTGLYPALLVTAPIELGYQLGVETLELGAGSYEAKRLRGSASRIKSTAFLAFDPDVQSRCAPLVAGFGRGREQAHPELSVPAPTTHPGPLPPFVPSPGALLTLTPSTPPDPGACCSG